MTACTCNDLSNPERRQWLIVTAAVGICTHLGCSPTEKLKPGADSRIEDNRPGGFICPCHGSRFDLAGCVFNSMPAPDNLEVPPHIFLSDTRLLIGEGKETGGAPDARSSRVERAQASAGPSIRAA